MVKVLFPHRPLALDVLKESTGLTALLALGILDNMEEQGKIKSLLELEHNSAPYLHALIESLRYVLPLRQYEQY